MASVEMLDLEHLRSVLQKDPNKKLKLWTILASRLIILHHSELSQFAHFTQDKIKAFCKMCEIRIYQPGEIVEVGYGGVLLHGSIVPIGIKAN
jgi:hypothetical protein